MNRKMLAVVAGVISNDRGEILIAKRPANKSHSGLWEFPGGKRELGEAAVQTLRRELMEEVGIEVCSAVPLVSRFYEYNDYDVDLQAWVVEAFNCRPQPCEGQELRWVAVDELGAYTMPEANEFVITALLSRQDAVA